MAPLTTLQADLAGEERAIRHLIGEQKALTSTLHRAEAREKLLLARIHAAVSPEKPAAGSPSGTRFPDVSSYQPHVDLAAVRADESIKVGSLVVFKATEGLNYTDGYLVSRWQGAAAAGFPHRGAYHFLHPNESGSAQAAFFLNELHRASADGTGPKAQDIVVCDAEVSDWAPARTVAQCVAEFGAYLLGHCPAKRWLYTGGPFAIEFGLQLAPFEAHWLPAYVGDPRPYYVPKWGIPVAWQYTDGRHGPVPYIVAGIGPCDLSIVL